MSTLASEIITLAYREANYIAVGETPTAEEATEALPRLRNLISSLFGFEIGEQLRDWYVPTENVPPAPLRYPSPAGAGDNTWAYPPQNVRLTVLVSAATTINFPPYPNDGARMAYIAAAGTTGIVTLSGNGRKIEGAASITAVGATTFNGRKWFYRADLGDWIRIDEPITEDDDVPLPEEFDDLFITGLATRLSPRFGTKVDDIILATYRDMLNKAKKRYKQSEAMPANDELQTTMRSEI